MEAPTQIARLYTMSGNTPQSASSTTNEPPSPAQPETLPPSQHELSQILESWTLDPMGCTSLGKYGILRSLTADRDVINAAALPPRLIKAYLDRLPYFKEAEDKYRGVDGTQTPRAQWFDADRSLLPEPLSEELKEQARKMMEEHALLVKEGKWKVTRCDGPTVVSDYDLGINE